MMIMQQSMTREFLSNIIQKRKFGDETLKYRTGVVSNKYNSYWASKEMMVRHAIDTNFEGFVHNKVISNSQGHINRIDHHKLINDTYLAIETDEYSHRTYDKQKEYDRYKEFHTIHGKRWIWIRFNPDPNGEENGNKTSIEHKIRVLVAEISTQEQRIKNFKNNSDQKVERKLLCY